MQSLSEQLGKVEQIVENQTEWTNPLLTDLYQITMAYAEWKAKRADENAVMEAYFRKAPFKGCFTIFAGLDEVLLFLKNYKFTEQHLDYIKS